MKRAAFFLVGTLIIFQGLKAQNAVVTQTTQPAPSNPQLTLDTLKIVDVYEKTHISSKKPISYVPIREADVMWSKDIWRVLDLREKMNQPLFFPTQPIGKRMSFFSLVLHGIQENNLHAFDDSQNNLFSASTMMTYKEIAQRVNANNEDTSDLSINPAVVKQLLIKEKWFFDKQHSSMKVQIVGICPIMIYHKKNTVTGEEDPEGISVKLFWIYFPEYRNLLANYEIFNRSSDAQNISFDDLFMQRRFASYIFAESNVYDNRVLLDYLVGDDILFEADKIKGSLMQMEHDLWEY